MRKKAGCARMLASQFVAKSFHFGEGVLVSSAVGGGDAVVEAVEGLVCPA